MELWEYHPLHMAKSSRHPQLLKTIGQVTNSADIKAEIESLTMHIVESCSKWNMTILSEAPCVVAKMLACAVIVCGLVGRAACLICLSMFAKTHSVVLINSMQRF